MSEEITKTPMAKLLEKFMQKVVVVEDRPEHDVEQEKQEKQEKQDRLRKKLEARGVPSRAADLISSGKMLENPTIERVRRFMASQPGTLVLSGSKGTGKTVAAAWAMQCNVEDDPAAKKKYERWPTELGPKFMDVARFARAPRWNDPMVMQCIEDCWVLVIDDVGLEYLDGKGIFLSLFDEILVHRHDNNLRTILTTNIPPDTFFERYGERVKDRLCEEGSAFFVIHSESMRGKIAP